MPEFRPLDADAVLPLIRLDVAPEQKGFVAPNAVTMAQSIFEHGSEIYGIWEDGTPVGLLAIVDMSHPRAELDDGDNPDGIYVWRLMVSADRQRQGFGRAAMDFAVGIARERGRAHVALSAVDGPGTAIAFYEKIGFRKSGRIVDGEIELTRYL